MFCADTQHDIDLIDFGFGARAGIKQALNVIQQILIADIS